MLSPLQTKLSITKTGRVYVCVYVTDKMLLWQLRPRTLFVIRVAEIGMNVASPPPCPLRRVEVAGHRSGRASEPVKIDNFKS